MRTLQGGIMHQVIDGLSVYVVEFDTMPELPITGLTEGERKYELIMRYLGATLTGSGVFPRTGKYALALTNAIETGVITKPGKYGIHLDSDGRNYSIYEFNE
jgi:hypothetical protein